MTFKPQNSGAALAYLKQRSAEDRVQEYWRENQRLQRAKDWLTDYHTRGHRTAFNWSPTITGTITKGATIEETKAEEVVHRAKEEDRSGGQGQLEEAQGQRRFDRGGEDFGDGDTPF